MLGPLTDLAATVQLSYANNVNDSVRISRLVPPGAVAVQRTRRPRTDRAIERGCAAGKKEPGGKALAVPPVAKDQVQTCRDQNL